MLFDSVRVEKFIELLFEASPLVVFDRPRYIFHRRLSL